MTQKLSPDTGVLTREFLHRSEIPGDLLESDTYPTPTSQVLLNFLLGWHGQLGGSLRNLTLCGDRACRTHKHVVKCKFCGGGGVGEL